MLITNTETISEEIDNTERVQVEDVARLWRGISPLLFRHETVILTPWQSTRSIVLIWKMMKGRG